MRFYLIDKVIHFEPGKIGVGIKNVTLAEEFFVKHYDRAPLMPEPLIIEAMAQMGGWTIAVSAHYCFVPIPLIDLHQTVSGVVECFIPGDLPPIRKIEGLSAVSW